MDWFWRNKFYVYFFQGSGSDVEQGKNLDALEKELRERAVKSMKKAKRKPVSICTISPFLTRSQNFL